MSKWEIVGSDNAPDHPEYILVVRRGAEDGTHLTQEEYDDLRTRLGIGPGVALETRASIAIQTALDWGQVDGEYHMRWVVDEMLRELAGEELYGRLIAEHGAWDPGIAP